MGWILNVLISNIVSWSIEGISKLMELMTEVLANALGSSPEAFLKIFPITEQFKVAFEAIGFGLVIGFLILGCVRNTFSGLGFLGEKPFHMVVRAIFAFIGVFLLDDALSIIYTGGGEEGIFTVMYQGLSMIKESGNSFGDVVGLGSDGSQVISMFDAWGYSALISGIIAIIFMFMICINFLKLLIEMFERYLMVNLLVFFSPLVASAMTLESTMKVFQTYLKMFFGQMMILMMNLVSLRIIVSGLHHAGEAFAGKLTIEGINSTILPFVVLLIVLAMLKIAQKLDNYMRDIGMVVGISGGNLTDEIIGTAHTLKPMIFGKGNKGSGGSGGSSVLSGLAAGGIVGAFTRFNPGVNAIKDSVKAKEIMDSAGNNVTDFGEAMQRARGTRIGSTNAKDTMQSPVAYKVSAGKSEQAHKKFVPSLTTENNPNANGINLNNLRGVRYSQGGMVGKDSTTSDTIAGSYTKPANMDYVSTFKDADGNDFYVKNETKANELYQASHNGVNSPEYEAVVQCQNTNGNFSDIHWNVPISEPNVSQNATPIQVNNPTPTSVSTPSPVSNPVSTPKTVDTASQTPVKQPNTN